MANNNAPFGLRPVSNPAGTAPWVITFKADTGRAIYQGQLVNLITGGAGTADKVEGWDGSTGTSLKAGVAAHYRATADSNRDIAVYVDPNQEYEIQVDDDTLADNADFVGVLFGVVNGEVGSTNTLQSSGELNGDSGTATFNNASAFLQGIRKVTDSEVDYTTANPRVIVKIHPAGHFLTASAGAAPGA